MKLIVKNQQIGQNYANFLRQAGYTYIVDRQRNKESFVRSLARGNYPRFHVYVVENEDSVIIDLHLDHKQASYEGQRMHNAEHEGDLVEAEIARLAALLGIAPTTKEEATPKAKLPEAYQPKPKTSTKDRAPYSGRPSVAGHGDLDDFLNSSQPETTKAWWRFW